MCMCVLCVLGLGPWSWALGLGAWALGLGSWALGLGSGVLALGLGSWAFKKKTKKNILEKWFRILKFGGVYYVLIGMNRNISLLVFPQKLYSL